MSSSHAIKQAELFLMSKKKKKSHSSTGASTPCTPKSIRNCPRYDDHSAVSSSSITDGSTSRRGLFARRKADATPAHSPKVVPPTNIHVPEQPRLDRDSSFRETKVDATIRIIDDTIARQEDLEDATAKDKNIHQATARQKLRDGNRGGALRYAKKTKILENELQTIAARIDALERQKALIESAMNTADFVGAMRQAGDVMQDLRDATGVEQLDAMMDEFQDGMDYNLDVQDAIARPMANLIADEDELLRELMDETASPTDTTTELVEESIELSLPMVPHNHVAEGSTRRVHESTKWWSFE